MDVDERVEGRRVQKTRERHHQAITVSAVGATQKATAKGMMPRCSASIAISAVM
jgi:hypothetical protein